MPRPKAYDPDEVLHRAMELFWEQGYQGTSIQALVERMRINRFSLYDTFGDKHGLWISALDRYRSEVVTPRLQRLEAYRGMERIRRYFGEILRQLSAPDTPPGCFLTNSCVELVPRDEALSRKVRRHLRQLEEFFAESLEAAVQDGELSKKVTVPEAARYLVTLSLGLDVLSRVFNDRRLLQPVVEVALGALR